MRRSVPIWMYHHVSPDREITPEGFERQLRHLLDQGYTSLSMSELLQGVRGERSLDRPAFVVTFDDGYLDNWLYAFPILKKLSVKAVMYLVTEKVERESNLRHPFPVVDTRSNERGPGGFFSWAEARAMRESGLVEFGSHTHTHRHWVRKTPFETIEQELSQSKRMIEEELSQRCVHLAWPWGEYEISWWPLLQRLGYETAVTTRSGPNTVGTNPLALRRINVSRENLGWFDQKLAWSTRVWPARLIGPWIGLDRRLKTWLHRETPYAHG